MYARLSGGTLAATGATTPLFGLSAGWTVVAAVTLVVAGLAVLRLIPRRRAVRR